MTDQQKEDLDIIAAIGVSALLFVILMILACYGDVFA